MSDNLIFPMTQGDLLPELTAALKNADGTPIDLTGATVKFYMSDATGAAKISAGTVSVVGNPTGGNVKYSWVGTDTDTAGVDASSFRGEFRVTYPGAKTLTVPNGRYIQIPIKPKLL